MKSFNIKQFAFLILGAFIVLSATSCSKSGSEPGGIPQAGNYGTHYVDPQLSGNWLWTSGSDLGYYDDNGTWQGDGYGFAFKVSMDANGNGTLYDHVHSDLYGNVLSVDIYYTGYYQMDTDGNLTFYSMGGRYKNSSGTDRALSGDEIYNPSTGTGRTVSFPAVTVTTINGRACFTSASTPTETDIFYKL